MRRKNFFPELGSRSAPSIKCTAMQWCHFRRRSISLVGRKRGRGGSCNAQCKAVMRRTRSPLCAVKRNMQYHFRDDEVISRNAKPSFSYDGYGRSCATNTTTRARNWAIKHFYGRPTIAAMSKSPKRHCDNSVTGNLIRSN